MWFQMHDYFQQMRSSVLWLIIRISLSFTYALLVHKGLIVMIWKAFCFLFCFVIFYIICVG